MSTSSYLISLLHCKIKTQHEDRLFAALDFAFDKMLYMRPYSQPIRSAASRVHLYFGHIQYINFVHLRFCCKFIK